MKTILVYQTRNFGKKDMHSHNTEGPIRSILDHLEWNLPPLGKLAPAMTPLAQESNHCCCGLAHASQASNHQLGKVSPPRHQQEQKLWVQDHELQVWPQQEQVSKCIEQMSQELLARTTAQF